MIPKVGTILQKDLSNRWLRSRGDLVIVVTSTKKYFTYRYDNRCGCAFHEHDISGNFEEFELEHFIIL